MTREQHCTADAQERLSAHYVNEHQISTRMTVIDNTQRLSGKKSVKRGGHAVQRLAKTV